MNAFDKIRHATAEDLDQLVAMWAQYMRAHALNPAYRQLRHDALPTRRRVFHSLIEEATSTVFVIESGGGLDGMISCFLEENDPYFDPPRYVRIQTPFVRPDARRQGNLRRLLQAAFEWAREWEIEEVRLYTGADNMMANAVSEELGFEAIEIVRRRPLDRTEPDINWEDVLGE
ncbi:MAG: GNAT family N-acetyltransferase [Gemmatimonadota bacterium]|nr:GNAT family N-acetyltransferase [Gemmatimonadota bacterium]